MADPNDLTSKYGSLKIAGAAQAAPAAPAHPLSSKYSSLQVATPPQATTPSSEPGFLQGLRETTTAPFEQMWKDRHNFDIPGQISSFAGGISDAAGRTLDQGNDQIQSAISGNGDGVGTRLKNGIEGAVRLGLGFVPGIGPAISDTMQAADEGKTGYALGRTAGLGLSTAAGVGVGKALGVGQDAIAARAAEAQDAAAAGTTTAEHVAAHAGILGRGNPGGMKNYIPQDIAADTTPLIRQAAADNPEITATARGEYNGSGQKPTLNEQFAAYQALQQKAAEPINALHNQVLASVRNHPFDPTNAQAAMRQTFPDSLAAYDPETAGKISAMSRNMGNINTMQAANDFRMATNKLLNPQYKANLVAAGRSPFEVEALSNAQDQLRDDYYKQLEDHTGYDLQGLKRTQASMMKAQEGVQNAAPSLANEQALAEQPMTLGGKVGAMAGMAKAAGSPTGITKAIAQHVFQQKPLTQIGANIRAMTENLPPSSEEPYSGPLRSSYGRAPARLPASASEANPIENDPNGPVDLGVTGKGRPTTLTGMNLQTKIQQPDGAAVNAYAPTPPRQFPQLPASVQSDVDAAGLPQMSPEAEAASRAAQDNARMRVHPFNMQLPTGFTTDPNGVTRVNFQAPDSLLNMQRVRAGLPPRDQFIRPRDPNQLYMDSPTQQSSSPFAENPPSVKTVGGMTDAPAFKQPALPAPQPNALTGILQQLQDLQRKRNTSFGDQ